MSINTIIGICALWNLLGLIFSGIFCTEMHVDGGNIEWENLNPKRIYERFRVNWFGTIFLTLVANLLCPIASIIYWFYKLCTVGRSEEK